MRISGLFVACVACAATDPAPDTGFGTQSPFRTIGTCTPMRVGDSAPASQSQLEALMLEVRAELFPELTGVPLTLVELDSETDFFQASLDLSTVSAPPLERDYRVSYNPRLFANGPSQPAIAAILAHELAHILDYTRMETAELVEFGIWYATEDVAEYERETDESAMWLGCADGLIDYRVWLYDNIPADAVADKERTYFTPAEIRTWVAERS